jgi:hypothetical protein
MTVKRNVFKQLEVLRRNRFFAEATKDSRGTQHGFRVGESMWNAAMTSSLIEIVKGSTLALLSPTIDILVARTLYEQNMDVVRGIDIENGGAPMYWIKNDR